MPARVLDGKAAAKHVMSRVKAEMAASRVRPGLAIVVVGGDRSAKGGARLKHEACAELGFHSVALDLPGETPSEDVANVIRAVGSTPQVHGVLLQLPLPEAVDLAVVSAAIPPGKAIDPTAATAAAVRELLEGLDRATYALVGQSPLFEAIASELGGAAAGVGEADVVIVGDARPEGLTGKMIRKGAAVVDLVGDVDARSVTKVAGAIGSPGAVELVAVAVLMEHTLSAARPR